MRDPTVFFEQPSLRNPALVAGFGGWPNAGEVSTWATGFLVTTLGGTRCAEIQPDEFYDFTHQRPVVAIERGLIRSVDYVSNVFHCVIAPGAPRDLVVFQGHEPHLRWSAFTEAFVKVAERLGVAEIFAVGGLYDGIPHTVPARVSGSANRLERLVRFPELEINVFDYNGPVSIQSTLLAAAGRKGIPASSLWGHVPHYLQSANPKSCLAVLERLQELAGFPLDLADVRRASRLLDEQIERIVQGKPELREHVKNLEQLHASGPQAPSAPARRPAPPQSPEEKVINIDSFLRKNHDPERSP